MNNLSNDERETHLNLVASERDTWICYTDDPVMAARLDKIAVGVTKGFGKEYTLRADQVVLRKGKRAVSDAQRKSLRDRLVARRALHTVGSVEA